MVSHGKFQKKKKMGLSGPFKVLMPNVMPRFLPLSHPKSFCFRIRLRFWWPWMKHHSGLLISYLNLGCKNNNLGKTYSSMCTAVRGPCWCCYSPPLFMSALMSASCLAIDVYRFVAPMQPIDVCHVTTPFVRRTSLLSTIIFICHVFGILYVR